MPDFHPPEKYRVRRGAFATDEGDPYGAFFIPSPSPKERIPLKIICGSDYGWQHVSVSLPHRCPTWEEMDHIIRLFWDDEVCVVKFHPPRSEWINNVAYCLHLWRPTEGELKRPPSWMVGVKALGTLPPQQG